MKLLPLLLLASSAMAQAPATPAQLAAWRTQIRHQLYVPDHLPPLESKTWATFQPVPGVLADRITYRTADGMIVPAIVYRPATVHGKLPGIVVINGHGGDKYSWYAVYTGMLFASGGAVVVTYDPIGEGERNLDHKSLSGAHDALVPPPPGVPATDWGQRLAGLMQVDEMQAVAYLRSLPQVDARRIATVGYSMGAFVSGIAGAIDPDIHAVLLSGGGTFDDAADGGKAFDLGKLPCQAPPWQSLLVLGPQPHRRAAILYALNAQRGPMFLVNGANDTVMDIPHRGPDWFADVRAKAIALRGTNRNMFTTHVDPGKSHRTAWVERPSVAWLNAQIHFPNWTPARIASMPTLHVADWVTQTGAQIGKNYLAEDREGGLQALNPLGNARFPAITRDQLTVLPTPDWTRLQPQLTYESWAAKTRQSQSQMPKISRPPLALIRDKPRLRYLYPHPTGSAPAPEQHEPRPEDDCYKSAANASDRYSSPGAHS